MDAAAHVEHDCDVAIVGKYTSLPDAYLSVIEALHHAGVYNNTQVNVHLIDGEELNDGNVGEVLGSMDGILVPGGFGQRAFEGKICAVRYARTHDVPFLGICLGMQAAVCEFARDVAGMSGRDVGGVRRECRVPRYRPDARAGRRRGQGRHHATGRLSLQGRSLQSVAFKAYGEEIIYERHRHRYEVNNAFRDRLAEAGLVISGVSPDDRLVEMVELPDHPWFVAKPGPP